MSDEYDDAELRDLAEAEAWKSVRHEYPLADWEMELLGQPSSQPDKPSAWNQTETATITYESSTNDAGRTTSAIELLQVVFHLHYYEIAAHADHAIAYGRSDVYRASEALVKALIAQAFPTLNSNELYEAMCSAGECDIAVAKSVASDRASDQGVVVSQHCTCGSPLDSTIKTEGGAIHWSCPEGHAGDVYIIERKGGVEEFHLDYDNSSAPRHAEACSTYGEIVGEVGRIGGGKIGAWRFADDTNDMLLLGKYDNRHAAIQALATYIDDKKDTDNE